MSGLPWTHTITQMRFGYHLKVHTVYSGHEPPGMGLPMCLFDHRHWYLTRRGAERSGRRLAAWAAS